MEKSSYYASLPPDVILRKVEEEAVLLNLKNTRYYSLDPVGTRMVEVLTSSSSFEQASALLSEEYDIDPVTLQSDLQELINKLLARGLIEIS